MSNSGNLDRLAAVAEIIGYQGQELKGSFSQTAAHISGANLRSAVECIRVIHENAAGHEQLAAAMLDHCAQTETGHPRDLATRLRNSVLERQVQQGDGPSAASPSHYQLG